MKTGQYNALGKVFEMNGLPPVHRGGMEKMFTVLHYYCTNTI